MYNSNTGTNEFGVGVSLAGERICFEIVCGWDLISDLSQHGSQCIINHREEGCLYVVKTYSFQYSGPRFMTSHCNGSHCKGDIRT